MREISLNGYIDDEMYFGDEITPGMLHDMLYDPGPNQYDDVHIKLNSYGGSCNAAVRMHDELVDYSINVFTDHGVNSNHNPYRIKSQQPHFPHKIMLRVYRTAMLVLLSL